MKSPSLEDFNDSISVSPSEMPIHRDTIPQHGLTSVGPTEEG